MTWMDFLASLVLCAGLSTMQPKDRSFWRHVTSVVLTATGVFLTVLVMIK